ncbi:TRAP transporter substrate-binding protein DctP [Shouchella shacheensis]|uniref:TRAP transporter substrate-binding protein DctP n=1 Tax=Shouchella shacheensis TaxID=1649580 RepID=UPI00073FDA9D|nr:TRAP transporter substrate-binding protein DctP [Shouchella shacheensis]
MRKSWSLITLCCIVTAGCTSSTGAMENVEEGENIVIDVSLPLGAESHHGVGVLKFGEELERLSEGRISVRPYYDNALGAEREVFEGMGIGIIDAGMVSTGPMGGFLNEVMLFDLPYIFQDYGHAHQFLDSAYGEEMSLAIEEQTNVKVLAWMENGFRYQTNSVTAVETPEDLVGTNHRTQESQVQIDTWETLGANATPMAWNEVYSALQQGVIDSQENPIPTIYDMNFSEIQPYLNMTQHVYSPAPLLMSGQLFEAFSEEDQELILEAAEIALHVQREESREQTEAFVEALEEDGMEVTYPDMELFTEAAAPVIEEWKEVIGEDLVEAARDFEVE